MKPLPRLSHALRGHGAALALALIALAAPACAADAQPAAAGTAPSGPSEPLAEVAGKVITRAEVEALVAPQLTQIDRQRRALVEQALERVVEDRILEAEAAARGVALDAFLKAEIEDKAGQVTDAEIDAFYTENQARINQPLENIRPQIAQFLGQERREKLRGDLVAALRVKHAARILLDVDRVQVAEGDGSPAKGPVGAPVTLIEFSDFECPFCSRVVPAVDQAIATYGDQVRVVFRQFPLNIHPRAPKAAEASLCAADQGKFWEMHDAMFAAQRELAVEQLKARAAGLGLDAAQFDSCLDSGKHAAKVAADMADGQKAGVSGTPAIFVNGRFINGAVPFETLAKVIDDELMRKGITPKRAPAE
jgi:protein-disulfide isomerase